MRRMISTKITITSRFITMPLSSQALYFHLSTSADDDGAVESLPIMRMIGANSDDLKILDAKGFIKILNDDLIVIVSDFKEHNTIRADRYTPSIYRELILQKGITVYNDNQVSTKCQTNDNQVATKRRHKLSKDKLREDKISKVKLSEKDTDKGSQSEADKILDSSCDLVISEWNKVNSTSLKSKREFRENLGFWLSEGYTIEEILYAIRRKVLVPDKFLKDISIVTFFRKSNSQGECNYIEQVLNYKLGEADGTKQRPDEHALEMHKFGETMYTIADLGSDRIDYLNGKGFELEKASHILDRKEDGYIKSYIVYKDNTLRDLID
jgi:hypothetical protein